MSVVLNYNNGKVDQVYFQNPTGQKRVLPISDGVEVDQIQQVVEKISAFKITSATPTERTFNYPSEKPEEIKKRLFQQLVWEPISGDAKVKYEHKERLIETFFTIPQAHKPEVKEFLRRVNIEELKQVLLDIDDLPDLTVEEQEALEKLDWGHDLFNNPALAHYALKLFIMGKIDREKVSEILIFFECTKQVERHQHTRTFQFKNPDNTWNEEAIRFLRERGSQYYNPEDLDQFLKSIEDLPPERTRCYTVSVPGRMNIVERIHELYRHFFAYEDRTDVPRYDLSLLCKGKNYFDEFYNRLKPKGFKKNLLDESDLHNLDDRSKLEFLNKLYPPLRQILFPPLLSKKFYQSVYKDNRMTMNLVLGPSISKDNFRHPHSRDIWVPFRGISQPGEADNHPADPDQFLFHDMAYHLLLDYTNPHREAWVELSQLFSIQNNTGMDPSEQEEVEFRFLDRETNHYKNRFISYLQSDDLVNRSFWREIGDICDRIDTPEEAHMFQKVILEHIEKNKARWKETYDITTDPNVMPRGWLL